MYCTTKGKKSDPVQHWTAPVKLQDSVRKRRRETREKEVVGLAEINIIMPSFI